MKLFSTMVRSLIPSGKLSKSSVVSNVVIHQRPERFWVDSLNNNIFCSLLKDALNIHLAMIEDPTPRAPQPATSFIINS